MKLATMFILVGAGFAVMAEQNHCWLWLWPALSFLAVGFSYAFPRAIGPRLFGKSASGSLHWFSVALLLPYLLYAWTVWHALRLTSRSRAYDEVGPGLFVGRRPHARELPTGVSAIVDLTSEFPAARGIRTGRTYHCLPTLDYNAPEASQLIEFARLVAALPGAVYIHCAAGKGRSVLVAILVLIIRGNARTFEEAEVMVRAARPGIRLSPNQRAVAIASIPLLLKAPDSEMSK